MINIVKGYLNLIGSQESSWLGVPTLNEITEHILIKLQTLEDCIEPPSEPWDLIHAMAKTPAAVINLMRYYYEPTDEDRLLKRKLPSTFHHNLARLVDMKPGQIIVTTNRDRLIEWGLIKFGITPQTIKHTSDLDSFIPFQQTKCTIIKLNGDYLDPNCPQFDKKFRIFLKREIQQIYKPVVSKCSQVDRNKFAEFNF